MTGLWVLCEHGGLREHRISVFDAKLKCPGGHEVTAEEIVEFLLSSGDFERVRDQVGGEVRNLYVQRLATATTFSAFPTTEDAEKR